jgi:hypothetical protein
MKWFLIYAITGMIYSALTLKGRTLFWFTQAFKKEKMKEIISTSTDEMADSDKQRMLAVLIYVVTISLLTIALWPFALMMRMMGINSKMMRDVKERLQ